jgi:hypothetical protein
MSAETPSLKLGKVCGNPVQADILLDGGPLAVCGVWDRNGVRQAGLYRIYHKATGSAVGPYYAELGLAEKGMKRALTLPIMVWDQPLDWYPRQAWFGKWLDENLGKGDDLVGGYWAMPDPVHICHWPACGKRIPPRKWGCREHWFRLPKRLRDLIWKTYVPGQEISKTPSRAYLAAAREVQEWIATQERKASQR